MAQLKNKFKIKYYFKLKKINHTQLFAISILLKHAINRTCGNICGHIYSSADLQTRILGEMAPRIPETPIFLSSNLLLFAVGVVVFSCIQEKKKPSLSRLSFRLTYSGLCKSLLRVSLILEANLQLFV